MDGLLLPVGHPQPTVCLTNADSSGRVRYESMLDSVLVARDRFLKPGGLIAPSQCTIIMAAIDADNTPAARKTFWNEVYGYKMSSMHKGVFEEAQIDLVEEKAVISDMVVLKVRIYSMCREDWADQAGLAAGCAYPTTYAKRARGLHSALLAACDARRHAGRLHILL